MIDLNKSTSARKSLLPLALLTGLIPAIWGVVYSLQSRKVVCAGASMTDPSNINAAIIVAAGYLPLLLVCLYFYNKAPKGRPAISAAIQLVVVALVLTLGVDFYIGGMSHLSQPMACSQGLTF